MTTSSSTSASYSSSSDDHRRRRRSWSRRGGDRDKDALKIRRKRDSRPKRRSRRQCRRASSDFYSDSSSYSRFIPFVVPSKDYRLLSCCGFHDGEFVDNFRRVWSTAWYLFFSVCGKISWVYILNWCYIAMDFECVIVDSLTFGHGLPGHIFGHGHDCYGLSLNGCRLQPKKCSVWVICFGYWMFLWFRGQKGIHLIPEQQKTYHVMW